MKKFPSRLLIVLIIAIVSSFGLSACGQKHLKDATAVSAGGDYSCALLTDRKAQCWGLSAYGQFGNGNTKKSFVPISVKFSSE